MGGHHVGLEPSDFQALLSHEHTVDAQNEVSDDVSISNKLPLGVLLEAEPHCVYLVSCGGGGGAPAAPPFTSYQMVNGQSTAENRKSPALSSPAGRVNELA